jgi:hypothetical protein
VPCFAEEPTNPLHTLAQRLARLFGGRTVNKTDTVIDKLHDVFQKKMHDVYSKNRLFDSGEKPSINEYNAWQRYIRDSLSLEVEDIEEGEWPGLARLNGRVVGIRIPNPGNAAKYSREFIIVPLEMAEKALVLGGLPDEA